ncbi:hypothetical protein EBB05_11845 [Methylobacterium brachiatum]|nr:hypothetical protein EBB05_11845 [Methylobacterium brachiatum]
MSEASLEGAFQLATRSLEGSFEGAAARRHLRMRGVGGADADQGRARQIVSRGRGDRRARDPSHRAS